MSATRGAPRPGPVPRTQARPAEVAPPGALAGAPPAAGPPPTPGQARPAVTPEAPRAAGNPQVQVDPTGNPNSHPAVKSPQFCNRRCETGSALTRPIPSPER